MKKVLAWLFLIKLVQGQQYPCCCSETKWEMTEQFSIEASTSIGGEGSYSEGVSWNSYDQETKRINSDVVQTINGVSTKYRFLQDFKQLLQYTIDAHGNCTKTKITTSPRYCVPAGSERVARQYFGSSDNPFNVDVYKAPAIYMGLTAYMTMTSSDCIPVTEELHGRLRGVNEIIISAYSNFTSGIKDPSVFDVPPQCQSAKLISVNTFQHYATDRYFIEYLYRLG